jgi:hypothetical protein
MKALRFFLTILNSFILLQLSAQQDTAIQKAIKYTISRRDSIHINKLNTSGTLMIAGGIGLCGAGTYLIWEGNQVFTSPAAPASTNPIADVQKNHQQGTAYIVAGGAAIAAGIILGAFGIKNRIDAKKLKKKLLLQTGLLDSGRLGACISY